MPQIHRHRTWCISCKDWKLHIALLNKPLHCETCENVFDGYFLSEISEEKIAEQQARYKASKQKQLLSIYAMQSLSTNTEDDAGVKNIIEERNKILRLQQIERNKILEEYESYSKLNRNDKCACGSDKKYKQCHLPYFQQHINI